MYCKGEHGKCDIRVIYVMNPQKLLRKECIGYSYSVEVKPKTKLDIQNIPIISEFLDVFPDYLPGLLP